MITDARRTETGEVEYTTTGDADYLRKIRNQWLEETDYLALTDATMSDAMKTYRQKLRDIPQQSSFPTTFIMPLKPE